MKSVNDFWSNTSFLSACLSDPLDQTTNIEKRVPIYVRLSKASPKYQPKQTNGPVKNVAPYSNPGTTIFEVRLERGTLLSVFKSVLPPKKFETNSFFDVLKTVNQ